MKRESVLSAHEVLEWYRIMGIEDLAPIKQNATETKDLIIAQSPQILASDKNSTARSLADRACDIEELKNLLLSFDGCDLKKTANNTVFSDGMSSAKIMLIGEAPGATEDELGIPFCGESGKLLDAMLASIGLSRKSNIYITNTIFWRPPANRRPTENEIAICKPFVEKHIALIKPDLLILVGATAVSSLLSENLQISKIRNEYYKYSNIYLDQPITTTAIFHPAYLLRQPLQKKTTWYDLLKIKAFISENQIKIN